MAKLRFSDEGIEVTIDGDLDKVQEYAGRLQKSRLGEDTLGQLIKTGASNPEMLEELVGTFDKKGKLKGFGGIASKLLGRVIPFLKGMAL